MRSSSLLACFVLSLAGCGQHLPVSFEEEEKVQVQPAGPVVPVEPLQRHERFVGMWAVEQPSHALYEVTYYSFAADGALTAGGSVPSDCSGHLAKHCVTGSVANCSDWGCTGSVSCLFGSRWHSTSASVLVIAGECSDGIAREIVLRFNEDSSSNSGWGGGGAELISVGGETSWSHDNWPWAFRKCPVGTSEATCFPGG